MFQTIRKIKKRVNNMSEVTRLRLFAAFVTVIMISCFLVLHKTRSDNPNYNVKDYRYYRAI